MPDPAFSIVVPTFNAAATLARALDSLAAQDWPRLEVMVIDGGSTDATVAIAEGYRPLVTAIVSEPDAGPADALNKGFARATGDLLGWLGSDDELAPGALRDVASVFASAACDVIAGACERVYPDGTRAVTRPGPAALAHLTWRNEFDQPALFWRRALMERAGPLDTGLRLAFDWDLWCRFKRDGARFAYTPALLARYHFPAGSLTSTGGRAHAEESFEVIRRHGPYRGRLAYLYRWLYRRYDLTGCYDSPPACGRLRLAEHRVVLRVLRAVAGRALVDGYNWGFASKQERGLPWWR